MQRPMANRTFTCAECGQTFTCTRWTRPAKRRFCSIACRDVRGAGLKHGGSARKHRGGDFAEYKIWEQMIDRCCNPNNSRYADYGGRGITVDPRWRTDFAAFRADMGPRPPGRTLDRKDNDKGYTRDNCHWATRREQQNNMRSNVILVAGGVRRTLAETARAYGVESVTLSARLKRGWTLERALTKPRRSRKKARETD